MPAQIDQENSEFNHFTRAVIRGVPVGTIVDIGASDGHWSAQVRRYWPQAPLLLIDANPVHENDLRAFVEQNQPAHYKLAAAGPTVGKTKFYATEDKFGGAVSLGMPGEFEVDQVSIDSMVAALKLPPPYFLKLDTHGYELEILQGAAETLKDTTLVQLEVYNFRLRPGVPVFPEMCFHMDKLGFRLSDIFDVTHRPCDGIMWQADALFEPKVAPWWRNDRWA